MPLELDRRQRAMLKEMGVSVWLPENGVAVLEQAPAIALPAPAATTGTKVGPSPDWNTLTQSVRACQACTLCAGRSHTTLLAPPDGLGCDWMVVGDPPDEDEDRAGVPFAGQAGVLLGNMLRALGLQRANPDPALGRLAAPVAPAPAMSTSPATRVYVTNVLKCRPAHGALPQAADLAQCAQHLQQEIALVRPRMILSMGRFANQLLLAADPALASLPPGKLRGTVRHYAGVPVVVTYAPQVLLRNSAGKALAWADLCLAATTLEA
jgi:DNA polymerase